MASRQKTARTRGVNRTCVEHFRNSTTPTAGVTNAPPPDGATKPATGVRKRPKPRGCGWATTLNPTPPDPTRTVDPTLQASVGSHPSIANDSVDPLSPMATDPMNGVGVFHDGATPRCFAPLGDASMDGAPTARHALEPPTLDAPPVGPVIGHAGMLAEPACGCGLPGCPAPVSHGPPPTRPENLSVAMCELVETKVRGAIKTEFDRDPIFGPAMSRLISLGASVQRRDGNLGHAAMMDALGAAANLRVISDKKGRKVDITNAAVEAIGRLDYATCQNYDLPPAEPNGDSIETDTIIIDRSTGRALAIESKRGAKLGRAAGGAMVDETRMVALLLREHLRAMGEHVQHGTAHVLVHHADRGLVLPKGMAITVQDLDRRFGTDVVGTTKATQAYHAALIEWSFRPVLLAVVAELFGPAAARAVIEHAAVEHAAA